MSNEDVNDAIGIINRYALAVDTLRWDLFDDVFTHDVEADFGGGAHWHDLASLKRDFDIIHSPFDATQHTITNHQVAVNGDRAHALSYVHGRFIRKLPEGGNMFESSGWYDDRLVRTAAGWRIKDRVCRMIWWGGNPRVLETMPGVTVEPSLTALRAEAAAGRIRFLDATARR